MKITKIKITNFKSIVSTEINPSDFNVNVGQNNHGKTNFFEALRWFFDGFHREETPEDIRCALQGVNGPTEVEITFSGLQEKIKNMESTRAKNIKETVGNEDEVTIKRSTDFEDGKRKKLFNIKTKDWEDPIGADRTWGEFLPVFEYVPTSLSLEEIDAYKSTTPIGQMLSGVLSAIIEKEPEYDKFRKQFEKLFGDEKSKIRIELNKLGDKVNIFLQKQFPDGTSIKFAVENPRFEELLKNFQTSVYDDVETKAEEKGDGMQRAVMLSIIQAYAEYRRENGLDNNFVFLIDEAELHLHPSAQRALKLALWDIAERGDQVFLNTHSSVLVVDERKNQKTFVIKKSDGNTKIKQVSDAEKPSIIFDLLGGNPLDLLLPGNILIVEGYSDAVFLREVVKNFYPDLSSKIQIVPANGDISKQDKSIRFIEIAYECFKSKTNPYSSKVIVVVDAATSDDKKIKYEEFKKSHNELVSSGRLFELPVGSIEEYYPDSYKKDPNELGSIKDGKRLYAEEVSTKITKKEFEERMKVMYDALLKAKDLCFG